MKVFSRSARTVSLFEALGPCLGVAALLLCATTAAGSDAAVQVLSAGIFVQDEATGPIDDLAPCPVTRMRHVEDRTEIAPDTDPVFGFLFSLPPGNSVPGDTVSLEVRLTTSGQPDEPARRLAASNRLLACPGKPCFAGWAMGSLGPPPPGTVMVELYQGGALLHAQRFTVQDSPRAATVDDTGTQLVTRIPGMGPDQPPGDSAPVLEGDAPGWMVQVSSCLVRQNALDDAARLRAKGYDAVVGEYRDRRRGTTWHTVRIQGFEDKPAAEEGARAFSRAENREAYVVSR